MSEYWISQGRRMCPYCKCWTADNKASINFHEQGKNHKENVIKKLDELRKKGLEDARKRENESSDLAKIEKAALESFKKDLAQNKGLTDAYGIVSDIAPQSSTKESKASNSSKPNSAKLATNKSESADGSLPENWATAYNEDGHLYYWNSLTNETSWYPPNTESTASTEINTNKPSPAPTANAAVRKKPAAKNPTTGYGQWETIAVEETETVSDYDLPTDSRNNIVAPEDIPLPSDPVLSEDATASANSGPMMKFKEKRVSLGLSAKNDEPVAFKKPKMAKKRQTRGALDDD